MRRVAKVNDLKKYEAIFYQLWGFRGKAPRGKAFLLFLTN
jgi:hypothetical protein